ncbi:MAG TPA: hypothetical protein VJ725_10775 [Thermoanaerobaculia bacterium]|nr:hypothetical protein [Thermoanaerobaculia bacterium]
MSFSDRVQQLNREISATVERALSDLRREVSGRLRSSSEDILRRLEELTPDLPGSFLADEDFAPAARELSSGARRSAFGELRDSLSAIDRARSQAEILAALLAESGRYASRSAVLLIRPGEIRGWGGHGFGGADSAVSQLAFDASRDGVWARLGEGQSAVRLSAAECAVLCSRLESPLPQEGVLIPLVLRDRVAAAVYADRLGDGPFPVEALQILTYSAAQAIESLPFRQRASTPTLTLVGEPPAETASAAPASTQETAPAAEPAPAAPEVGATQALESSPQAQEPEVEAEPETEPAGAVASPEPEPAPWTAEDEQSAVTAEPEPEPAAPPATPNGSWGGAVNQTEQLPVVSAEPAAEPPAMEAEVPRYPRSVEPEPAPAYSSGGGPEATVLLPRPNLREASSVTEPAVAPPPLRPVAPPSQAATESQASSFDGLRTSPLTGGGAGTPEVRPPTDLEGPGWAFNTTRVPVSPSDETMHEEARRLARLLVSEIKLYNEDQVEDGRRNRDLYERLKEDIDRSRQMYEERVDPRILRSTDYFYQELVRILAAGDSRALGI